MPSRDELEQEVAILEAEAEEKTPPPPPDQESNRTTGTSWNASGGGAVAPETGDRPGRNDPCYCGSGKKYKKCHGR